MHIAYTTGKILNDGDVGEVYETLYPARKEWRNLGMKLGLGRRDLDNIEDQYSTKGAGRCLEEVVSMYLNRPSLQPTWQAIIDALKSKMVNEEALGVEIEERYGEFEVRQDQETVKFCVESTPIHNKRRFILYTYRELETLTRWNFSLKPYLALKRANQTLQTVGT